MSKQEIKNLVFTTVNYEEATKITGQYFKNKADAEDLVQEFFLKTLDLIERGMFVWKGTKPFMGWCHKTLQNMALTELRAQRNHKKALALAFSPEDRGEGQADIKLSAAIDIANGLPVSQRNCYVCYYLNGISYEEIARRDGLSISTVRSQCSRAKKAIVAASCQD